MSHRISLDANVLFSAAWSDTNGLLALWRLPAEQVRLTSSDIAISEARRNLPSDRHDRLDELLVRIEIVTPPVTSEWSDLPDVHLVAKDLPILHAAIASGATHLITGDRRHFADLYEKTIRGVLVLQPSSYLASFPDETS